MLEKAYWVLSTECILTANQWHWLVGNKISLAPAIPRGKQGEKQFNCKESIWYVNRENVFQQDISFLGLSGTLLQCLAIFWHEKNVFPFVLVSKVCRQSERGFHLLVHSVDQLANNIYRVNICLWLNQRRKTGHTWTIFNSCWVNIISFIGCSEELKSLKIPVQVITRCDSVFFVVTLYE